MKRKIKFYKVLIFIVLLIFGCEKQSDTIFLENFLLIDTLSKNYDFNVEINKQIYDDYYSYSDTSNIFYLDINIDGIQDLKIMSFSNASSGGLNTISAMIETLNSNIKIATIEVIDTFCTYTENINSISYQHHENFENNKVYNNSLELQIDTNLYPSILNVNDTIDKKNNWNKGAYYLVYINNSTTARAGSSGSVTKIRKGIWNMIDKKFIGLNIENDNNSFLGWLELGVNNNRIFVYRYAIKRINKTATNSGS